MQIASAAWRAITSIVAGVGDLMQKTGNGCIGRVLGGWTIERSGGAVCGLHRARGARVSWLSIKIKVDGFPIWASKPAAPVW
jgi:hypothetical protein